MYLKRQAGFTLIEVLIALFIIAIALTAAIQATNRSVTDTSRVQEKLAAHWVGLSILSQIQGGLLPLADNSDSSQGKAMMLRQDFSWEAKTVVSPELPTVARVEISVKYNNHLLDTVVGYAEKN